MSRRSRQGKHVAILIEMAGTSPAMTIRRVNLNEKWSKKQSCQPEEIGHAAGTWSQVDARAAAGRCRRAVLQCRAVLRCRLGAGCRADRLQGAAAQDQCR